MGGVRWFGGWGFGRVGQMLNATSLRPPGDLGHGNIVEVDSSARIPFKISVSIHKRIPANHSHCGAALPLKFASAVYFLEPRSFCKSDSPAGEFTVLQV